VDALDPASQQTPGQARSKAPFFAFISPLGILVLMFGMLFAAFWASAVVAAWFAQVVIADARKTYLERK
jgi:hypothetical protein